MASGFHATRPIRMRRSFFMNLSYRCLNSILAKRGFTPNKHIAVSFAKVFTLSVIDSGIIVLDEGKKWRNASMKVVLHSHKTVERSECGS